MLTREEYRYLHHATKSYQGSVCQKLAFRQALKQELYALRQDCPKADYAALCAVLGAPETGVPKYKAAVLAAVLAVVAAMLALYLAVPQSQAPDSVLRTVVYSEGKLYICTVPGCTVDEDEVLQTALRMVGELQ